MEIPEGMRSRSAIIVSNKDKFNFIQLNVPKSNLNKMRKLLD